MFSDGTLPRPANAGGSRLQCSARARATRTACSASLSLRSAALSLAFIDAISSLREGGG